MMNPYKVFCILMLLLLPLGVQTQESSLELPDVKLASWGIKTNLVYDATATFSLGTEFRVARKWTIDVAAGYNPWTFSNNKKWKHFLIQPEGRYWLCEAFNKHFLGIHAHYAKFNAGNVDLPFDIFPGLKEYRYQGWLVGGGVSYGHQWYLSPRWSLEAQFGFGYAYVRYDRYDCGDCGAFVGKGKKHYWGPTKVGLSFIYLIK